MLEKFENDKINNLQVIYGGKDIIIEDDVVGKSIVTEDIIDGI